jgi:PadR family transcriptional regulator, regulatory protein PadR
MAKQDHLGEFEQLALLAVMRLGDEAYGARIQEELDGTAGRSSAISSIYITLTRLEAKGLVRSSMGEPTDDRGGKPRRYFRVEPAGVGALREARERLLSMWTGLEGELERARGG